MKVRIWEGRRWHCLDLDLLGSTSILFFLFNEVGELLEIEEAMLDALIVLLLIDEVIGLDLVLLHSLLLVLTHQLGEGAIELAHILREELSIPKDLKK